MLEKTIEVSLLFDFYGKLLTERQQEIFQLYYHYDLSLAEVATKLGISRQGVYDHLHRGEDLLHKYEDQLGLVIKYRNLKEELTQLNQYINRELDELNKENNINYSNLKTEIQNKIARMKNQL